MSKQDYVLKKYVSAHSAAEAIRMDADTEVSEAFLVEDKPKQVADAIGFHVAMENDFD